MLKARRKGIENEEWTWIAESAGQRLFQPPNVAGWDEQRWLDTARISGRWSAAGNSSNQEPIDEEKYSETEAAGKAVAKALDWWGNPTISKQTRDELLRFSKRVEAVANEDWEKGTYRGLRQMALRMLIATSPDFQTS
jgi:hypothetical protein